MKTVAFVPLRLNSQRVAGKNLRLLGGEPLMCHILRTLAGIGEIDEVYAYCSDERICEYLPEACVSCAAAPASTATRRSGGRSTTVSRPTSRPTSTCWRTPPRRSSARRPWRTPCGTCGRGVRFGVQRREDPDLRLVRRPAAQLCAGRHPRTQTIEPVYIETSAFFIFPRTLWCGRGRRIGEKPYMAVVDRIEGLDIDNPEDFTMAEIIAASRRLG